MNDLEPIAPATAKRPAEVPHLIGEALSEGDLEAALALYEPGAALRVTPTHEGYSSEEIREVLATVMDLRLLVQVHVSEDVEVGDLALVLVSRAISGPLADGRRVEAAGAGGAVVRHHPAHGWRLVVDNWCLSEPFPGFE